MAVNSFNAQNPPVNTKGDLFTFSTIPTRLGVGANNTVLTADSSTATGLKWAAVSGWNPNYQLLNAGGTALTGSNTITISGISGKNSLLVYITSPSSAGTNENYQLRLNGDNNPNYIYSGLEVAANQTPNFFANNANSMFPIWFGGNTAASTGTNIIIKIDGTNAAGIKPVSWSGVGTAAGTASINEIANGIYTGTSAISSVSINTVMGNFDNGTIFVYGA